MRRVLHLFNIFGAMTERAIGEYVIGLSTRGFDLTLGHETWSPDAPSTELPRLALQRIAIEPTTDVPEQMRRIGSDVSDPAMLDLLSRKLDLIHGHFGPRILQGAAWLSRGVPMVVSLYGYDVGRLLRDPCWVARYRWAADHGATFVTLARSMEQSVLNLGLPRERVRRVHLGIDLSQHRFDPRPAPEIPRFVFIGRFVDKKGPDVLLDAMAHLVGPMRTPARLTLIGGGPNEAAIRAQARRLCLDDCLNFAGALPFNAIFPHLAGCTALVQPSVVAADGDAEGAPMVLMTAQACGVPCITTRHSGNPETLPPAGQQFVVPERDAVALASAMNAMIQQGATDRAALQAAGRRWIEEHYDVRSTVSAYAALYSELTAQSG